MTSDAKPGDWVRFYQGGKLVIGEVRYLTRNSWERGETINTEIGPVKDSCVLEVRRAAVVEAEAGKDA